ncbi:MAG: hypothetical protein Q8S26_02920 [Azonexus sp.]|nr:hypothetical protein [Azonexus sp.]
MTMNSDDAGVVQVLLDRFNNQRLPKALAMKARVDAGETLQPFEVDYLADVLADVRSIKALVERHPEYEALVVKGIGLYKEITEKALANEAK